MINVLASLEILYLLLEEVLRALAVDLELVAVRH
jgi:hypothetical protein